MQPRRSPFQVHSTVQHTHPVQNSFFPVIQIPVTIPFAILCTIPRHTRVHIHSIRHSRLDRVRCHGSLRTEDCCICRRVLFLLPLSKILNPCCLSIYCVSDEDFRRFTGFTSLFMMRAVPCIFSLPGSTKVFVALLI
jgi:hypothetical protein